MSKKVLAETLANLIGVAVQKVIDMLNSVSASYSQPHAGSTWVTVVDGTWLSHEGIVVSAYFHPSRPHTATTVGKLGTKKSTAGAG
jgi:hypothetical protein